MTSGPDSVQKRQDYNVESADQSSPRARQGFDTSSARHSKTRDIVMQKAKAVDHEKQANQSTFVQRDLCGGKQILPSANNCPQSCAKEIIAVPSSSKAVFCSSMHDGELMDSLFHIYIFLILTFFFINFHIFSFLLCFFLCIYLFFLVNAFISIIYMTLFLFIVVVVVVVVVVR